MKLLKLYFSITFVILALCSCKSKPEEEKITPATELYGNGIKLLKSEKFGKAAEEFGKVFFQHPGNEITPQAELMQAYSLFLDSNYEEAIDVLDMFTKLHPLNEDIAYAYYLKALCYYMQISSVKLDQFKTLDAKESFEDVIKRFPGTKYAIDAALKIDLVNDHLGGKEMEVGRFYLNKNNPIAAIKRFQNVANEYQTTSHATEALYRLVECYLKLGLLEDAKKYAAVLGHNYSDSIWYKYAYGLLQKTHADTEKIIVPK